MQATAEWLDTDYYEVLGVRSDATTKQIKSAYRKLARTAHPDANPDDPTAEQRFSDIAKAYEVLSDPDRRPEYDEVRSRPRGSHFGEQGYRPEGFGHRSTSAQDFDMADLFDLFGAQAQPGQRPTTNWPLRGRDLIASLRLDFESAINGLTQSLELDGRNVKTRIPAGVQDGQTIRLAGKGGAEANGGPSGDLFIEIAVDKHPVFGRSGRNLTVTVPISYADAALGGEMRVPTLDGAFVTIKVPAGTQVGKTFRVPGRGVPHPTKPGNLLASATITVPTSVTDENSELLRQLSA